VGTADRPPVRARSGRRPLPPLIFLLVLAVAALGTWWYVLHQGSAEQSARDAACASAAQAAPSLEPSTLTVRVLNGTDQQGLAQTVAKDLQTRGFTVSEFGNDSSGRKLSGVGEIRFGARGREAASYMHVYLPGATSYQDTRATATVDLVIGPQFKQLASPDQVAAALKPGAKAAEATC
jgi:hypothetical protein